MQSSGAQVNEDVEIVSEELRLKLVIVVEQWLNENPALYIIDWEDVSLKIASEGLFALPMECRRIWWMAVYKSGDNGDDDSDFDEGLGVDGQYRLKVAPKINLKTSTPITWSQADCIHLPHVVDDSADPSFETMQSYHNRNFDESIRFYLTPALNRKTKKVKPIIGAGPLAHNTNANFPLPDNKKPRMDNANGMHNSHLTLTNYSKDAFADKVIGQQSQQFNSNSSTNSNNSNRQVQQQLPQSNQYVPLYSSINKPNKPIVYTAPIPAPPRYNNMQITQQQILSQFPYRPFVGPFPQPNGMLSAGSTSTQAAVGRAPLLPAFHTLGSTTANNQTRNV